jgi:hypothetical protein
MICARALIYCPVDRPRRSRDVLVFGHRLPTSTARRPFNTLEMGCSVKASEDTMRTTVMTIVAAASVAGAAVFAPTQAEARCWRCWGGAGFAAGVIGGALIARSAYGYGGYGGYGGGGYYGGYGGYGGYTPASYGYVQVPVPVRYDLGYFGYAPAYGVYAPRYYAPQPDVGYVSDDVGYVSDGGGYGGGGYGGGYGGRYYAPRRAFVGRTYARRYR